MDSTERVNLRCSAIVFRREQILLLSRMRSGAAEWVLPGGTPRAGESVGSCVRREVAEETGLHITADRVAFVLEATNAAEGLHLLDLVFTVTEQDSRATPRALEPGLIPVFHRLDDIGGLRLRPPIAGHLRGLRAAGARGTGAYLGNVWRPAGPADPTDDPAAIAAE